MEHQTQHSLSDIIKHLPLLQNYAHKLLILEKLECVIKKHLDPEFAKHCRVANLQNGILILTTTSVVWNHKLRFQKVDLLRKLRSEKKWCFIKSIKNIVQVSLLYSLKSTSQKTNKNDSFRLSTESSECIIKCADQIAHLNLSQALYRLARHTRFYNKSSSFVVDD